MIQIRDAETKTVIGTITEEQLRFLIAQLEEEWVQDRDYYIMADTLEMFEEAQADPQLIALLRQALGNREGIEIAWTRAAG
jgi:processive 1,2-diacylglycerol beta-glucosyltransferase